MAPRTFTVATTLQDPLSAERLVDALTEAGIDAFTRTGGAASSAAFAAAQPAFYDLLVATESLERAEALIAAFSAEQEQDASLNSRAAEEEWQTGGEKT
jgi:shikimate 5-dehydrogenase